MRPATSVPLRVLLLTALLVGARAGAAPDPAAWPTSVRPTTLALELVPWVDGLALPVAVAIAPEPSTRWWVVQLEGLVIGIDGRTPDPLPFLDLRHRVTGLQGEQGLFSIAIEPLARAQERERPRFVVAAFTERDSDDLVVAAYPIDEASGTADGFDEVEVLRVPMPEPFHHGGQVRFGPDGLLYVSVGDGSVSVTPAGLPAGYDAPGADLRGRLLRIDLLPTADRSPAYALPPDGARIDAPGHAPETWAYGFRNPWKFAFDPGTGDLIAVDVGADRWEEVHRVVPGGDHGWPAREGPECVARPDGRGLVDPACGDDATVAPWIAYGHPAIEPEGGRAVAGGLVVRDPDLPELAGRYLFGDFVTGRLWSDDPAGAGRVWLLDAGPGLTAVDEGPAGEVLLVSVSGTVRRLVAVSPR